MLQCNSITLGGGYGSDAITMSRFGSDADEAFARLCGLKRSPGTAAHARGRRRVRSLPKVRAARLRGVTNKSLVTVEIASQQHKAWRPNGSAIDTGGLHVIDVKGPIRVRPV